MYLQHVTPIILKPLTINWEENAFPFPKQAKNKKENSQKCTDNH